MPDGFLEVAGGRLYYQVHGQGPDVVLVHGVGGNHAIWYRQLGPLSRSNRVISFDQRGFGRSEDRDGRGRAAFVDDLTALLDHLGSARAALIGQSMGAGTCIGFAMRHPARVAALAIADSLHGLSESPPVRALMDQARHDTAALSQIERVLGHSSIDRAPELAELYRQISSFNQVDRHSLSGRFDAVSPADLSATAFPVLFVAGVEDRLFPIEAIRQAQSEVAGSFLVEIPDAGHSAFFEQPTLFNDTILSLLQMAGHVGSRPAHSNTQGYSPA